MNRYIEETDIPEWMAKDKTILIQKYLLNGTFPKNYRSVSYLPADHLENTNGSIQGGDALFDDKSPTLTRRTEMIPQGNRRNKRSTKL